ncbi:adenyl-nucleotide exchange factor sse1 [Lobosporangium transversale]|uniref:Heat shock protein 70 family n=1 Tax=Lobosporangium transversale TaxID=64571 RepID=A0A1Y2GMZ5_9FUNG|nr:heat shock protein 70 family [Lobosporangium transversale]KAF9914657.1 adenyl-nucleotide exchange factor sse1 [Lobosporangium transversale]ORZ13870.1 heat shock protein 70 family [Lobosporangium transversale]|eukprot:XP_021880654.1 heat shock protein 70 family [Lobosporangium transversale]
MSVVGIDLGNLQTIIAVARNRGIDVICNEVSNRFTPSLVSFGPKQRYLGETAKTQEISNFKNTVSCLKRIIGRTFADKEIQEIEKQYLTVPLVDINGQLGVKVNYQGQETTFTVVQIYAMYLTKMKEIATVETKLPVSDCVIAIPSWFTDVQRRAVLDASEIAGLNVLRLINDSTAIALGYGITKTDLPEEKPRNICFVDVGHSSYTVSIVSFIKGQLTIKARAFDRHFGGRDFDRLLVNHFADQFKTKYGIDVKSNGKAIIRLMAGCEKLKKVLSANSEAPLNIESIMEDRDVSSMMKRSEFEELAKDLISRCEAPLKKALDESGLKIEDIDAVEMVGGSIRIPALKERIQAFFGKELSSTLNQDEAVARGAALQCAILSPSFKVRDFTVQDITSYPIKITWQPTPEEDETELVVFNKNNSIPSTKVLTFYRSEPFDLEAHYAEPQDIPAGINPWIGRFSIKKVEPVNGEAACVKVKARVNIHGILSVESAYVVEEVLKDELIEENANAEENPDAPLTRKVKKLVKKGDLPVVSATSSLDRSIINELREKENEMIASDKLVVDTEMAKNTLEEFIYDTRSKVSGGAYKDYINPADKDKFIQDLNDAENWLYDEGEETTKSVYFDKLKELQVVGNPVIHRYREAEARPLAGRELRETINNLLAQATSTEEKYAHIPEAEKNSIVEKCSKAQTWIENKEERQSMLKKYEEPVVTSAEIRKQRDDLIYFATPILNKPKPKPVVVDTPPAEASTPSTPETKNTPETKEDDTKDMDID